MMKLKYLQVLTWLITTPIGIATAYYNNNKYNNSLSKSSPFMRLHNPIIFLSSKKVAKSAFGINRKNSGSIFPFSFEEKN